ncbi:hypothetical protein CCO04_04690 [Pimelobacter sp. 30-1]|nr:hypothetical protein [Pimelobacter sp. 30-1]
MRPMTSVRVAASLVLTSALTLSACGGATLGGGGASGDCLTRPDQGITDSTITLGSSMPLSGQAAGGGIATAAGMKAYAAYVNSTGGIEGSDGKSRTIELVIHDDGGVPSRALANVNKLINEDKVFALVTVWGTASNLAIRAPLAKACLPSIWPMTGAPEIGNPKYPWQTGGILANSYAEGANIARVVKEELPGATVAILEQNDDSGAVLEAGFTEGIKGSDVEVVERVLFETTAADLSSEATTLAASKADVFLYLGSGGAVQTLALQRIGDTGWKPRIRYVANFGALFVKPLPVEVQDGLYHNENMIGIEEKTPAMRLYLKWAAKDEAAVKQVGIESLRTGWVTLQLTATTLGDLPELTHQELIDAMHRFRTPEDLDTIYRVGDEIAIDFPDKPYPVTATALNRWNGKTQKAEFIKVMRPEISLGYRDLTDQ